MSGKPPKLSIRPRSSSSTIKTYDIVPRVKSTSSRSRASGKANSAKATIIPPARKSKGRPRLNRLGQGNQIPSVSSNVSSPQSLESNNIPNSTNKSIPEVNDTFSNDERVTQLENENQEIKKLLASTQAELADLKSKLEEKSSVRSDSVALSESEIEVCDFNVLDVEAFSKFTPIPNQSFVSQKFTPIPSESVNTTLQEVLNLPDKSCGALRSRSVLAQSQPKSLAINIQKARAQSPFRSKSVAQRSLNTSYLHHPDVDMILEEQENIPDSEVHRENALISSHKSHIEALRKKHSEKYSCIELKFPRKWLAEEDVEHYNYPPIYTRLFK